MRIQADRLGFDFSHFSGLRRWSDTELADAVSDARSWDEVGERLGLVGGSCASTLKGHAKRLGLDARHLSPIPRARDDASQPPPASLDHLARAGSMLAAAWFTLRGYDVAWPLEPCRYDLIVTMAGKAQRIQVKTTRTRACSTWKISLTSGKRKHATYDPDEIDFFFAIDGDFECYLIPVGEVGGLQAIHLAAYSCYRLDRLQPVG